MILNSYERKHYSLSLPREEFNDLEEVAHKERVKIVEFIRRAIKFYIAIKKTIDENPDAELLIRENGRERQIILL